MLEEELIPANGSATSVIEPADLIPLSDAAREFNIRRDTLQYRIDHNGLPSYKKMVGDRERVFVSRADMEKQPPVDESKRSIGHKRPDVAERNRTKRKYTRKGTENVSHPQEKTRTEEEQELERHVCYAFGRVQAWLDIYAGSIGLPPALFTNRVGKLFQQPEGGSVLGIGNRMPGM